MTKYYVEWTIDIEADSPREAAEKALAIHRNPESTATVFSVSWETSRSGEHTAHRSHIDLSKDIEDVE